MPVVNTKGVATGLEVHPDGTYRLVFTRWKNGLSKSNQKPKATATFTIKEPKEKEGKNVLVDYSFDENALWRWKGDMIKLGVPAAVLEDPKTDTDKIFQAVQGKDCLARIGSRVHEGRTFNTVDLIDQDAFNAPSPSSN